jgi:hypothetical protein
LSTWTAHSRRSFALFEPPGEAEYSIAAVSRLTGMSCHALRVWELRYGFPARIDPDRGESDRLRSDLGSRTTSPDATPRVDGGEIASGGGQGGETQRAGKTTAARPPRDQVGRPDTDSMRAGPRPPRGTGSLAQLSWSSSDPSGWGINAAASP